MVENDTEHLMPRSIGEDFLTLLHCHGREELGNSGRFKASLPIANNAVLYGDTNSAYQGTSSLKTGFTFHKSAFGPIHIAPI